MRPVEHPATAGSSRTAGDRERGKSWLAQANGGGDKGATQVGEVNGSGSGGG